MQAPPPYSSQGRKKSNVGLIIGLVVLGLAVCCILPVAFLVKGGLSLFQASGGLVGCSANLDANRNAAIAYAKKHGGVLPPATDWRKDIAPYLNQPQLPPPLKATPVESGQCDPQNGTFIGYNAEVAGKKWSDVRDRDDTVLFFEFTGSPSNSASKYTPQSYRESPKIFTKPRGWMRIGPTGDAYFTGPTGIKTRVSSPTQSGSINIQTSPPPK